MKRDPFQTGRRLSWATAVTCGATTLAGLLWLRPALPGGSDPAARLAHLGDSPSSWIAGWFVAALSVVLLLSFLVALARTLTPGYPVLRTLALHLAGGGAAASLCGFAILSVVLPSLSAGYEPGATDLFLVLLTLEGVAVTLFVMVGAGLFSLAGVLLTYAAMQTPPFPRILGVAAFFAWGAGFMAAGATLAGSHVGIDLLLMASLPLLAIWTAGVGAGHFRAPAG